MTGPIAYTRAITPLLSQYPHRFVDCRADMGFQYSIFERQGHTALFPRHYVQLRSPVIKIGAMKKLTASAFRMLRGVRNVAPARVRAALSLRRRGEL